MPIGIGTAALAGGVLSGVSSIFGAGKGASAAQSAAQTQAQAAQQAAQLQFAQFQQTQQNLAPWMTAGQEALSGLLPQVLPGGGLTAPVSTWGMTNEFSPTMASLEQTPGYQFTRQQGLQAVTNSYAPQGLAGSITGRSVSPSGPLAAGQTQYASGLASTTFNQQYQNWLAGQQFQLGQRQQQYNMLGGIAGSGQNAAAGLGSLGLQAATGAGNFLTSGAAASAAGTIGAANAAIGGVSGLGGAASNTALLLALNNQGLFGGGGGTVPYSGGYNPANTAVDQNFSAGP